MHDTHCQATNQVTGKVVSEAVVSKYGQEWENLLQEAMCAFQRAPRSEGVSRLKQRLGKKAVVVNVRHAEGLRSLLMTNTKGVACFYTTQCCC